MVLTKAPLFYPIFSSGFGKIPSFSRQFWVKFTQFGVFLIKALLYYKITYFPCTNSCFGFDQNPPYLPHFILPFLVKLRFSLRYFGSNSHNLGFFYYGFSSPTKGTFFLAQLPMSVLILRGSMGSYGVLWGPMGFYGVIWGSVTFDLEL